MIACKACGEDLSRTSRTPFALELLGMADWPVWLDGLCLGCLYDLSGYVEHDDDGEIRGPLSQGALNEFLAAKYGEMVRRLSHGKLATRCECVVGGIFIGDPDNLRCTRYASRKYENRDVCYGCSKRLMHGAKLSFVDHCEFAMRPFLIWASTRSELIAEATRIAAEIE